MKDLPAPTLSLSPTPQRGKRWSSWFRRSNKATAPTTTPIVNPVNSVKPLPKKAPQKEQPLTVSWARHLDEVREAQRLRYSVFATEMGAKIETCIAGHDIDRFDDYCEHLLVRDCNSGLLLGTYRILTPAQAKRAGGLYSDQEFDLSAIDHLRDNMVELGRSCVHSEHRSGSVIMALWTALAHFLRDNKLDTMIGCASIPMDYHGLPSGQAAASIWEQVRHKHLTAETCRATPNIALPVDDLYQSDVQVEPPALIRAYLRLGTKILGAPAWDPEFHTADLPMMMQVAELPERFRKSLFKHEAPQT